MGRRRGGREERSKWVVKEGMGREEVMGRAELRIRTSWGKGKGVD